MSLLLSQFWPHIAAALAAVAGALGLYLKGRSDANAKAELKDITHANTIRKQGADARDRVAADVDAGRLRDDDGHRRD